MAHFMAIRLWHHNLISVHEMPSDISLIQTIADIPACVISAVKYDMNENHVEFDQFPEGGTAAWCAVVGGVLAQFCCFGYITSFGVYQEFYTLNYLKNESASAISWIGSVNAFLVGAIGPVAGTLYDRGYFYHMLIGGSLLQSFSLFMLSLTQSGQYYQIFLAQGIGLGVAQGLVFIPSMAVVSHYFYRHRMLAMSLVACGSSLGAVIYPIMLNYLFNRGVGFANGVRINAALVTVLLIISCLLLRTRLDPPKRPANYLSVGRRVINDVPFCLMSAGFLFFQIGFYFPLFYLQLDSVQHGNSETFSFYSLVLLNGGSLFGRLSAGFIAPYVGVGRTIIISTTACAILILGMIGLSRVPSIVIIGTIYGCFAGIYIAMITPLVTVLTSDLSELGVRIGIGIALAGIGVLVGGPISGALLTSQYKWWQPALFCGLIALLGCLFLVLMEIARTRRQHASEKQELNACQVEEAKMRNTPFENSGT